MAGNWTFGQKVGAGFALTVALALVIGAVSIYSLRSVIAAKDQVIAIDGQNILDGEQLSTRSARAVLSLRGYFLSKQDRRLDDAKDERQAFLSILDHLRQQVRDVEGKRLLDDIAVSEGDYNKVSERMVAMKQIDAPLEAILKVFDDEASPKRIEMTASIDKFIAYGQRMLESQKQAATATGDAAISLVIVMALIVVVLATACALILTRALGQQIATAVSQVQSSSAELQAAANQQATGAREQSTAMNEISTTISELLATSRQIAESAQRVAQIAEQTASSARAGDSIVDKGHEAVAGIRRQVDLIVNHMLDLGKKSQQIGSVLEIVAELAEQTNILAINATIEAAGAGEAGKRFSVVAEEIRKLADRVGGSTKEIRGLIDDVRSAVNTTVMTTETGSKAVEAGARQFAEVAASFKQIAGLVGTTTEASKEIELSTKQQTTAVEQVNVAITNVAQATKESEASTGQTLQTASQLSGLSRELLRLVQPQAVDRTSTLLS